MPTIANPQRCFCGYHVITANGLLSWLDEDDRQVWTVGIRGPQDALSNEIAAASARLSKRLVWNAQISQAFAADCAEHRVLPIFAAVLPAEKRWQTRRLLAYLTGRRKAA